MSRRRKIAAAWIAVAVLALSGCSPNVASGVVVDRDSWPERWDTRTVTRPCGKNRTRTTTRRDYTPARYRIELEDCSGVGSCRRGTIAVDRSTFNDLEIGERYPRSAPAVPKAAP